MEDDEYGSECFPRSEYKTRFSETSAFEMSDPEYWGTYFRSTASDDDCDRLSNLKSKDYQNRYTNAPHATSVSAGTFHSPWHRTQYSEIFHATPETPRLVYEPAFLYDLLLAYKKFVCVRVENLFNKRGVADGKMEVYLANEYPCIMVKIEEFNNVPKETRSLYNIAIAYFVAITNKIAQLDNIPVELVIRSSFGHNIPSVAQTRTSFRINIGIVPEIYTEVLVKSLIQLNNRVLVPLFNLKFLLNLDAVQIENHNEEVAMYNDRKKSNDKSQPVCMWSEHEALFKILTKVGDYTGRRVSAHIIRREKHIDLLANYVSEELDRSQPNLGNPLIKLLGQLSYCERPVLNVAEEDYNKISLHKFSVEEENPQIKKDFVFWRIMQYVVLALDVKGIPEAMEARRLTGLYGTLEKLNLEFIRNSGCQEAQDGCGSDSDCEVRGAPSFYSKKLTVATGMRAINLAQFLSIYHLRQSGFNPRAYAEKCFFETKEAIETVSDIFTLLGLQSSAQQHRGDATVRYVDLSYCAACGPESISLRDVLNRISKNDVVVLDYTSTNTEKISTAVSIFIKKVEVVILVSSGLKNEQLGADMNPYGTIRIVARDRRLLNELYFVLKKVLEQGEELLPKHLHRIRKAYKNAGAVVTNKAIYRAMYRKSSGDLNHDKSLAPKSNLSKGKFNTLAC
ncbi:unnamed protein product [Ixodes pacificus]